jgi:predicted  nucleic acid-binding Zn-ribbon protein
LCVTGSSWETGQLKTELSEAKAEKAKLEEQIKKLHHLRMELDVMYEDEKTRLIKQQDRDRERVRLITLVNKILVHERFIVFLT